MGILGWSSASFSADTPRRFSAVSCASKEATTMDSSDATWHTKPPVYSPWASDLPAVVIESSSLWCTFSTLNPRLNSPKPHTCCSDCNSCWPEPTASQKTTKQPRWNMVKPYEQWWIMCDCKTKTEMCHIHSFHSHLEAMTGFQTLLCLCWNSSGLEVKGRQNIATRAGQLRRDCCGKLARNSCLY